ncbi:MAG: M18 family aminopeptidase [Pseudomonadales bacterium]|nr:M18 family aminopeptidase [Pseudomonadales bacterium]
MKNEKFNDGLLAFLQSSPTPYHAVQSMEAALLEAGFIKLNEKENWYLEEGGRYFAVRNGSSIVAFIKGREDVHEGGIRMVGAHTDSPCLKVKPNPDIRNKGFHQLGVEVYGGVLINPWFDRDLSLAGRVAYENTRGELKQVLLDFVEPVAVIPSLAIHLDREANNSRSVNLQRDIVPIFRQAEQSSGTFNDVLVSELRRKYPEIELKTVLDYEMCLYDTQQPARLGFKGEFIASARLDNLLSCYVGLQALVDYEGAHSCLLVCNDHEEVGSCSAIGAQGPMLHDILLRWLGDEQALMRVASSSLFISADNAHGVHPNYTDKHDSQHGPLLNSGPVIKLNANQRYASNAETAGFFRLLCERNKVPVQSFVMRSDMACGSTIGPITASAIGVKTLDVGVPTFAMHSIREMAGADDPYYLYQALNAFFAFEGCPGFQ